MILLRIRRLVQFPCMPGVCFNDRMNFAIGALTGVATSVAAWLLINLLLRARLRWTPIEIAPGQPDEIALYLTNKRRRSAIDISCMF